jgi:hypothetical protein
VDAVVHCPVPGHVHREDHQLGAAFSHLYI